MATDSPQSFQQHLCAQPLIQESAQQKIPQSNLEIPAWGSGPAKLALDGK